jgi:hypothetical protein
MGTARPPPTREQGPVAREESAARRSLIATRRLELVAEYNKEKPSAPPAAGAVDASARDMKNARPIRSTRSSFAAASAALAMVAAGCSTGTSSVDAGGSPDTGGCMSALGGECGSNMRNACTCDVGLECTPGDSGLPFGDVGGTCQPLTAFPDAGGCTSTQGGHCGGNTAHPCGCAGALVCSPADSGLPFGDVGGTCQPASGVR